MTLLSPTHCRLTCILSRFKPLYWWLLLLCNMTVLVTGCQDLWRYWGLTPWALSDSSSRHFRWPHTLLPRNLGTALWLCPSVQSSVRLLWGSLSSPFPQSPSHAPPHYHPRFWPWCKKPEDSPLSWPSPHYPRTQPHQGFSSTGRRELPPIPHFPQIYDLLCSKPSKFSSWQVESKLWDFSGNSVSWKPDF